MGVASKMADTIVLACEIAFKLYKKGEISKDKLIKILQISINSRAKENGYEERFGLPFPEIEGEEP